MAIEARKAIESIDDAEDLDADTVVPAAGSDTADGDSGQADAGGKVISLHTKRLPPDLRPGLPDMSKYDRLLKPATTTRTAASPSKRKGTSA